MSKRLEELDWRETPMGELTLRRRRDGLSGVDVYEVKLGDEFLMSSLFTVAEIALARLGIDAITSSPPWDVVVGGLGLGYTAAAALESGDLRSLLVVDRLAEVIECHRRGLVPVGPTLTADPRCRLVAGDFFALAAGAGLDPEQPGRQFDAVLLDVDHAPRHLLDPSHAAFYTAAGTARLAGHLRPGGAFALWSTDPPAEAYAGVLAGVFAAVRAEVVRFPNPLQDRESTNTVYVARGASVG